MKIGNTKNKKPAKQKRLTDKTKPRLSLASNIESVNLEGNLHFQAIPIPNMFLRSWELWSKLGASERTVHQSRLRRSKKPYSYANCMLRHTDVRLSGAQDCGRIRRGVYFIIEMVNMRLMLSFIHLINFLILHLFLYQF
jgi:hypothetical protein